MSLYMVHVYTTLRIYEWLPVYDTHNIHIICSEMDQCYSLNAYIESRMHSFPFPCDA